MKLHAFVRMQENVISRRTNLLTLNRPAVSAR
jgi:hypothetical protein